MNRKRIVFLVIIICIYLAVSVYSLVIFSKYLPDPDIAGIGQLCIELLLFPTVIIGFWITIKEFQKTHILPKLELIWRCDNTVRLEKDFFVIEKSEYEEKRIFFSLFIRNNGEAIANWYRISFSVPKELARPLSDSHLVTWHISDNSCSSSSVNTYMTHHEFRSNGNHSIYPDSQEMHIATLELKIYSQLNYPNQAFLPYSIVTDKTKIQNNACKIRIIPETL